MSIINNCYHADNHLFARFGYHVVLGLKKDLGDRMEHPKKWLEKVGDAGLWIVEELPCKIWKGMKDPRVVTVALTALALLAASFLFYPSTTWLAAKAAIAILPVPPFWAVKFSAYILTVSLILSSACRALGRFTNERLMNRFYGNDGAQV